jgi:hypothetical protein
LTAIRWTRTDWIALLAVTALAAVLRFYQLGDVPPGFQFDEAFNAVDAQQVIAGNRPLFLPANAGREVVYTYWQALLVSIFGLDVRTLRLASAIFGVLAIPVTYVLLRVMLRRDSRRIALFTSLVLTVSLWHIHFSHYGIRVIMMPVVFSIAFGAFWLGHQGRRPWIQLLAYVVSGLFLGLSVWTHPTGRLAPFVLGIYTGWLLWHEPESRRLSKTGPIAGLLISGLTAFAVFVPLGLEFYRHPEFFTGHASEVSVFAERVSGDSPLVTLGKNVLHVLGMFVVAGDREWTHNLAGRPVFDLAMGLTFFAGVAIWARRIARNSQADRTQAADRNAYALLAIWAVIMLLPSVLSEAAPNYSRTTPALPALFVAGGLGLTWIASLHRPFQLAGIALASLILVYSGIRATYDYFVVFPAQEEVYYWYDADKLDALDYLATLTDDNQVYLSQLWGTYHATVSMLRHQVGVKSLDTSDTLVLPPSGMGAVYAFPSEQLERAQQIADLWPDVEVRSVPDRFGNVLLYLVELPAGVASEVPPRYGDMLDITAAFDRAPDLLGQYATVPDKQTTLLWSADEVYDASLTSYVHLIDPDGQRVAQIDKLPGNGSYRTDDWSLGEQVLDRYYPAMLDKCAAGIPLRAQVGWYSREEGHAARLRADAPGETALAGTLILPVLSHDPGYFAPQVERNQPIRDDLAFRGYNLLTTEMQPGSPITVDLYWRSDHEEGSSPVHAAAPITLTLEATSDEHEVWSGELAPDSDWDPNEEICRRVRTRLPADLQAGSYRLVAHVGDMHSRDETQIDLEALDVLPSTRQMETPQTEQPVAAVLVEPETGDEFMLVGVNGAADDAVAGGSLELELVWQAETSPVGNYKGFVHLVDESGSIISQSDREPSVDYPTNHWLSGEVVVDTRTLAIPEDASAGSYALIAGLYDPVSAVRLKASESNGTPYANDGVRVGDIVIRE